jgi:hypothetical protein
VSEKPSRITIANCSERAAKILRLALDPAAADGEWRNAAVMFVGILRQNGIAVDSFTDEPRHHRPPDPPWRSSGYAVRMPFGKHKGEPLDDIATDYLQWLINTATNLRPPLRRAIVMELERRRDG